MSIRIAGELVAMADEESKAEIDRLKARVAVLERALETARITIKALHGIEVWDIYNQHSPEMKQINAALRAKEQSS